MPTAVCLLIPLFCAALSFRLAPPIHASMIATSGVLTAVLWWQVVNFRLRGYSRTHRRSRDNQRGELLYCARSYSTSRTESL